MAFTFPSSPSTGTLFIAPTGVVYVWDGTWTTFGDTQTSNPFQNSFLYRSIYTKGYMSGGYKNSSPWRNVNKTIHATDLTTNLGDKLVYNSSYIGGGFSDFNSYVYPSTGAVQGSGTIVEAMSMTTETMFALDAARYLKTSRTDCEALMTPSLTSAYVVGGGSTTVDRHNFVTDVMFSAGTAPACPSGARPCWRCRPSRANWSCRRRPAAAPGRPPAPGPSGARSVPCPASGCAAAACRNRRRCL